MSSVCCLYCGWDNPASTSYCNDCGASLALRPCRRCKSSSRRDAASCTTCGAAFVLVGAWSGARSDLAAVVGAVPQAHAAAGRKQAGVPHAPGMLQPAGTPRALAAQALRAGQPAVVLTAPAPEIERDVMFWFALAAVLVGCAGSIVYVLHRAPPGPDERRAATAAAAPADPAGALAPPDHPGARVEPAQLAEPAGRGQPAPARGPPAAPALTEPGAAAPALADTRHSVRRASDAPHGCTDAVVALGLCEAVGAPIR